MPADELLILPPFSPMGSIGILVYVSSISSLIWQQYGVWDTQQRDYSGECFHHCSGGGATCSLPCSIVKITETIFQIHYAWICGYGGGQVSVLWTDIERAGKPSRGDFWVEWRTIGTEAEGKGTMLWSWIQRNAIPCDAVLHLRTTSLNFYFFIKLFLKFLRLLNWALLYSKVHLSDFSTEQVSW